MTNDKLDTALQREWSAHLTWTGVILGVAIGLMIAGAVLYAAGKSA